MWILSNIVPYLIGCSAPWPLHPRDLQSAMYTTETSAGSNNIMVQRQVSPNTNRYLLSGMSFEGGIFTEQQTTFV